MSEKRYMKHRVSEYLHTFDEACDRMGCRAVVVIDPEDREQVERLFGLIEEAEHRRHPDLGNAECGSGSCWIESARAALREFATPKPPRPEEPTGLGAVVEDAAGTKWIRHDSAAIHRSWLNTDDCETRYRAYEELDVVRVLSEGVR